MIRVDIEGLFEPVLTGGLSPSVRDAAVERVKQARTALRHMRDAGKVGFFDVPSAKDVIKPISSEVTRLRALADDLLVLGIGGSSLGGQALIAALGPEQDRPVRVHFMDNIDPDTFGGLLERLDPGRTAVAVITKSGGTVETIAQLLLVRRWLRSSVGAGEARTRMTFVTDPERGLLRELAQSEGIRAFDIPGNVGGRFSVLTPVGLLPAAFVGIDIEPLLKGAAAMAERIDTAGYDDNPAMKLAVGALLGQENLGRHQLVMMPYCDALRTVTAWFVQLWAESLGKRHDTEGREVRVGQTPISAVGATDQHAQLQLFVEGPLDKMVVLPRVERFRRTLLLPDELGDREDVGYLYGKSLADLLDAERRATRAALLDAGVPVVDLSIETISAETVGELLLLLEASCALVGVALGINPFDQPGVEAGKRMAFGLMGRAGYEQDANLVLRREARSTLAGSTGRGGVT